MERETGTSKIIFELLYILKRLTDKSATIALTAMGREDFNITFMPYFMSIGEEGISNHDLLKKIKVTRQAVSKTIKELESLGLVYSTKSESDARSIMVYLTVDGKSLHESILKMADERTIEYKKLIGVENFNNLINSLIRIAAHHEEKEPH